MKLNKKDKRIRRHKRVRKTISGTETCPRLAVFRSNKHIYAQLIDDVGGVTLLDSASTSSPKDEKSYKGEVADLSNKCKTAYAVGRRLGEVAKDKKIKKVIFDRGGNKFHGRVKALAEGARDAGLVF